MKYKFGILRQNYIIAINEAQRKNYERCDFHDECDDCKNPKLGSFAYGGFDNEVDGYRCGKCILKLRNKK